MQGILCDAVDSVWAYIDEHTNLFEIPVVSNILDAGLMFFWHLFGCCRL